jgi:hypothetical protein
MSVFDDRGNVRPGRAWFYGLTAAFVLFIVLPVTWWAVSVATSGTKGTGDLTRQRNSAGNRAHWSAVFNSLNQQINADQQMIATAKQSAGAPGATRQDQINLTGLTQNCLNDVAQYNGDVGNTLAVLPDGLPTNIPNSICGG